MRHSSQKKHFSYLDGNFSWRWTYLNIADRAEGGGVKVSDNTRLAEAVQTFNDSGCVHKVSLAELADQVLV